MLRLIKHHLTTIDNVEIYPLISLGIFVVFFAVMLWWVLRADKGYIKEMKQYPLND